MQYSISNDLPTLQVLSDQMDAKLGYPQPGDGPNVDKTTPGPGWTLHYSSILTKPDGTQYAYGVADTDAAAYNEVVLTSIDPRVQRLPPLADLDDTWTPHH